MNVPYLKSKAATILWVLKLLIGAFMLYALITSILPLIPVIAGISKEGGTVWETVKKGVEGILEYTGIAGGVDNGLLETFHDMDSGDAWLAAIVVLPIAYAIFLPVISILDAIGATLLRFKDRGTGFVQASHGISAAIAVVFLIEDVIAFVWSMKNQNYMTYEVTAAGGAAEIIGFILYLMIFFYHFDVIKAMRTAAENIDQGKITMKRTRLGFLAALSGVAVAVTVAGSITAYQTGSSTWLGTLTLSVFMLKQFMVAVCYSQMKQYNN